MDEFQNIAQFVYRDEKCEGKPDESLPGSYHLVLRNCFDEEIEGFVPDYPKEFSEKLDKLQAENRS